MYQTIEEVIEAILQKYEGVENLSKRFDNSGKIQGCLYSHKINGIGCAIGCLIPKDVAETLDVYGTIEVMDPRNIEMYIRPYISENVLITLLGRLQAAHDTSDTVEQFKFKLKHYLENKRWLTTVGTERVMKKKKKNVN